MKNKTIIEKTDWETRFQTFNSGNRGRITSIRINDVPLVENKKLEYIEYDPIGKGNDIIISLKNYVHIIKNPIQLYITKSSIGVISEIEILDQDGNSNNINLE